MTGIFSTPTAASSPASMGHCPGPAPGTLHLPEERTVQGGQGWGVYPLQGRTTRACNYPPSRSQEEPNVLVGISRYKYGAWGVQTVRRLRPASLLIREGKIRTAGGAKKNPPRTQWLKLAEPELPGTCLRPRGGQRRGARDASEQRERGEGSAGLRMHCRRPRGGGGVPGPPLTLPGVAVARPRPGEGNKGALSAPVSAQANTA